MRWKHKAGELKNKGKTKLWKRWLKATHRYVNKVKVIYDSLSNMQRERMIKAKELKNAKDWIWVGSRISNTN